MSTPDQQQLLAATQDLQQELSSRVRELECFAVLASLHPEVTKQVMTELETQLEQVENATLELNRVVDREAAFVQRALTHVERWNKVKNRATRVQAYLQSSPSSSSRVDDNDAAVVMSSSIAQQDMRHISPPTTSSINISPGTTTSVPTIAMPSQTTFASVPRYVISKLTYANLGLVIDAVNEAIRRKNTLLSLPQPPSNVSDKALVRKWTEHARLCNVSVSDSFIFEDDVLDVAPCGMTTETITTGFRVLRHLGKLRYVGNGVFSLVA